VNDSLLAHAERVALDWLARKLPAWWTPNRLTAIGVAGSIVVFIGYFLADRDMHWLWLSNLGLLIHWFGDSLDGTMARVRKIERPRFGFYLDQVIDTIGNLFIGVGVAICPYTSASLVLIALSLYSMLGIQVLVRTIVDREFQVAVGRFGPTELRLGIMGLNLFLLAFGPIPLSLFGYATNVVSLIVLALDIFLLALLVFQMSVHLHRLSKEDPPRI
jgi:phosphatidylglycerophosphate synthase